MLVWTPLGILAELTLCVVIVWISMLFVQMLSLLMWGIVGNKDGALAGLLVLVTAALGILKLFIPGASGK